MEETKKIPSVPGKKLGGEAGSPHFTLLYALSHGLLAVLPSSVFCELFT